MAITATVIPIWDTLVSGFIIFHFLFTKYMETYSAYPISSRVPAIPFKE
jgi:hypothetical protein